MKRDSSGFIWGIILIVFGLFIAGKQFDVFNFSIMFDGWWTLFIIIPCFIGLFNNEQGRMSYVVGLCIGILLLLSAQDIVKWSMFGPLLLAFILVIAGINIMFKKDHHKDYQNYNSGNTNGTYQSEGYSEYNGSYTKEKSYENNNFAEDGFSNVNSTDSNNNVDESTNNNYTEGNQGNPNSNGSYTNSNNTNAGGNYSYTYNNGNQNYSYGGFNNNNSNASRGPYSGNSTCACTAVLSGKELRFDNQEFRGAVLSAVLGGIEIDLRNAIIRENVVIDAKTVMGGIDIYVPNYVRVVVDCTPILGGVDNKTVTPMGADASTPVIFINATCVLGGIDVK